MKIIGLCGSSGAGKGFSSLILKKYGVACIDTDLVYRKIIGNKDSACVKMLTTEFGAQILNEDGTPNKSALAKLVFEGEGAEKRLKKLNEITHHFIKIETDKLIDFYRSKNEKAVAIDAPVLFESGFDKMCDITICVTAPREKKIERIIKRDGITYEKACARLDSQLTDEELIKRATHQIDNSGASLEAQIIEILKKENLY